MPLWTYTKRPNWTPQIPEEFVRSTNTGWIDIRTGERLVVINQMRTKHDLSVANFEWEDGTNILLENDDHGKRFLLLE